MIKYRLSGQDLFKAMSAKDNFAPAVEGSISSLKQTYINGQKTKISPLSIGNFIQSQQTRLISELPNIKEIYYLLEKSISIECKALISSHEEINLYTIKEEAKEKVGKLMIYNNPRKPTLKFTFLDFIVDDSSLEPSYDYVEYLKINLLIKR